MKKIKIIKQAEHLLIKESIYKVDLSYKSREGLGFVKFILWERMIVDNAVFKISYTLCILCSKHKYLIFSAINWLVCISFKVIAPFDIWFIYKRGNNLFENKNLQFIYARYSFHPVVCYFKEIPRIIWRSFERIPALNAHKLIYKIMISFKENFWSNQTILLFNKL